VLIHEYEGTIPVYHFDVYRLTSPHEFEDLGAADYWNAGGLCLVEWADRVVDLLPEDRWIVRIEPSDGARRRIRLELPPSAGSLLADLASHLL
jgi:tRNA threonylcarbamoyladenosine biosynthesis protein TsaE